MGVENNLGLLKDYQAYLRVEKGLRPLTCEAYGGDLKTFAEFLEGEQPHADVGDAGGCGWISAALARTFD